MLQASRQLPVVRSRLQDELPSIKFEVQKEFGTGVRRVRLIALQNLYNKIISRYTYASCFCIRTWCFGRKLSAEQVQSAVNGLRRAVLVHIANNLNQRNKSTFPAKCLYSTFFRLSSPCQFLLYSISPFDRTNSIRSDHCWDDSPSMPATTES